MRRTLNIRTLLFALLLCAIPAASFGGVFVSINLAPPVLPVYVQPPCPVAGYMWTPGYWAYGPAGYYWVPGVWVAPPRAGLLWTPGYWGHGGGAYVWHAGYWGPHVGFYGGVHYGFGYGGIGFVGGVWQGGVFRYNTAVVNVNRTVIHNTYVDRTVVRNTYVNNRVSYNGPGGVNARPTLREQAALREQHFQPTANQISHRDMASRDRAQFASVNSGHPETTAMGRINGRRFDQQGRIAQGVRSGEMTAGEAHRAENRQQNIKRSVRNDRRANGGRLTPQERRNINQRQNNASRQINRERHNDRAGRR